MILAPAMNGKMWQHPATQRNVARVRDDGGRIIGPSESGMLACGYEGAGRLVPVEEIFEALEPLDAG